MKLTQLGRWSNALDCLITTPRNSMRSLITTCQAAFHSSTTNLSWQVRLFNSISVIYCNVFGLLLVILSSRMTWYLHWSTTMLITSSQLGCIVRCTPVTGCNVQKYVQARLEPRDMMANLRVILQAAKEAAEEAAEGSCQEWLPRCCRKCC
jgi:hypothetical protein